MTGSNSMSSGYCSLDEEGEDVAFFTAKSSFFRQPPKLVKVRQRFFFLKMEGGEEGYVSLHVVSIFYA